MEPCAGDDRVSEHRLTLTVKCEGEDVDALADALAEVARLIRGGFSSGHNSNDEGNYSFDIKGYI